MNKKRLGSQRALIWLLLAAGGANLYAISLSMTTGSAGWTVTVPTANMPTVAGNDISVSTYTSASSFPYQTVLRVTRNPGGWGTGTTGWYISAHKTDTTWHSNLHLYIRCRSPTTGWNYRLSSYGELTATDIVLVRKASHTAVSGISFQFQLTGVSVVVGTSNTTTVVYTLTEY